MSRRKRVRERWKPGTVLWQVPIRFYDDPIPEPERCTVLNDDSTHDYEDEFSLYGLHHGYGHEVYLNPDDLYETLEECKAEIQRRRAAKEAESKADIDKLMASIDKELHGKERQRAIFAGIPKIWAEGDKREPGRFADKTRFAPKARKAK